MSVKKKANSASLTTSANGPVKSVSQNGVPDQARAEADQQLQTFEEAVKLFRARQFDAARELFGKAVGGPLKEISHNSRLHILVCDRRTQTPVLELDGLEDHYNYAIERLNVRDLECAREHLEKAMHLSSGGANSIDHLFYALALCAGLAGDPNGAYENLKRAIEINPKNRHAARNDSDFAAVAQQPLLQQLLYPEKFGG